MKKIFAFCLAAVMLLSLAACGQDVPENDEAGSNPSQQVGAPSASGNPENEGNPDIVPEDDPGAKSSQQTAEQGQINLPEKGRARRWGLIWASCRPSTRASFWRPRWWRGR